MMIDAITFSTDVSVGNILTSIVLLVGLASSFVALRERSKTNGEMIKALKERMDRCDIEQMKERTNTMWILQLRRGLVEAEVRGLAVVESPLTLTDEALLYLKPLLPKLRAFYERINGDKLTLIELADKLEVYMGHEIAQEVCRHVLKAGNKEPVSDAACLVLAIAILRPISSDIINVEAERTAQETIDNQKLRDLPPKKDVKGGGLFGWRHK